MLWWTVLLCRVRVLVVDTSHRTGPDWDLGMVRLTRSRGGRVRYLEERSREETGEPNRQSCLFASGERSVDNVEEVALW